MLNALTVRNFKSLSAVTVALPRLSLLVGANAAGKSHLLEAILTLSRVANARTLADALAPLRGDPVDAFHCGAGGLPELLSHGSAEFMLEADISAAGSHYRYRVRPQIDLGSGALRVTDEYLTKLTATGRMSRRVTPAIKRTDGELRIRRRGRPSRPRREPLGLNRSVLSHRRLTSRRYPWIEAVREELADWHLYRIEPRATVGPPRSPTDVRDVGPQGEDIAPFLYKLQAQHPKHFAAIGRVLRSIVPDVEAVTVDFNEKHGTLDLQIRRNGVTLPARSASDGTLSVLALAAITVNPWNGSLVALERPETSLHPRRLALVARLLTSLAFDHGRQVVATTHSPLFCDAILREARTRPSNDIAILNLRRADGRTEVQRLDLDSQLLRDPEVAASLTMPRDHAILENLILRGLIDECPAASSRPGANASCGSLR